MLSGVRQTTAAAAATTAAGLDRSDIQHYTEVKQDGSCVMGALAVLTQHLL